MSRDFPPNFPSEIEILRIFSPKACVQITVNYYRLLKTPSTYPNQDRKCLTQRRPSTIFRTYGVNKGAKLKAKRYNVAVGFKKLNDHSFFWNSLYHMLSVHLSFCLLSFPTHSYSSTDFCMDSGTILERKILTTASMIFSKGPFFKVPTWAFIMPLLAVNNLPGRTWLTTRNEPVAKLSSSIVIAWLSRMLYWWLGIGSNHPWQHMQAQPQVAV